MDDAAGIVLLLLIGGAVAGFFALVAGLICGDGPKLPRPSIGIGWSIGGAALALVGFAIAGLVGAIVALLMACLVAWMIRRRFGLPLLHRAYRRSAVGLIRAGAAVKRHTRELADEANR